jgi:uncharacterized damage-inducible protein DinB
VPSPTDGTPAELALLLALLDQSYDKKAWHGPNLRGSVRRVSAEQAAWRPGAGRRSIAEIVLHAAYWKYIARRRLRGDRRGSFAFKGSNWFEVGEDLGEGEWHEHVRLLDAEHRDLRTAVALLPPPELNLTPAGSKVSNATLIAGVAAHDVYHAGQIQLLKRLFAIQ